MWTVLEHPRKAAKVIDAAPQQVREKYTAWKQLVEQDGPYAPRKLIGYWDHALTGDWAGFRASSLSRQYRVIYRIDEKAETVLVEKIGPHDY